MVSVKTRPQVNMFNHLYPLFLITLTNVILCVKCAAVYKEAEQNQTQQNLYNYEKFDEVYDQRQNGSENYKVNVDGVVLVWAPPESLFSAITMLEPGLLEGVYPDIGEILKPQKPEKPEDLFVVSPEKPSSSTTTSLPPTVSTENNLVDEVQNNTVQRDLAKRKHRLPGFMRPFVSRRRISQ